MPPGCKGTRSVSSSGSDFVKVAATLIGLSAAKRNLNGIGGGSSVCEIIFDLYEDCMNKNADDSTYSCDYERKRMEPCGEFKKVPGRQSTVARHRAWVESVERQATAAGFASAHEYLHDKIKSDPSMCHIAYVHYKKCIEKHGPEPFCEIKCMDCPQFKKAP